MLISLDDKMKVIILRNERVRLKAEEIGPETDLIYDLHLDSIALVNLFVDLEEDFQISIAVEEITPQILSRFQLLKEYLVSKIAEQLPSS